MLARARSKSTGEVHSTLSIDGKVKIAGIVVSVVIYKLTLLGILIGFWQDTKTNQAVFDVRLAAIQQKVEKLENLLIAAAPGHAAPRPPGEVARNK